ncbi:aldo/keto reductase [Herbiconiux ginsengi]|uniref:Predicted oxidoreductase n=1 Tax=Herbiconiux ginsengi TaxID=381665 RepID=A0A1H3KM38_9MICO|nr:aldo/keto reductase [Herbiconiux ginsengi]SDY52664.1 Predicted oxidoreductase [Herbiconiux ginsengi]
MSLRFFLGTASFQTTDTFPALDAYFDAGGRDIDTARVYGRSEEVIGAWMTERGNVGELRLLTKGGHPDTTTWASRLSRAEVLSDARTSVDLLGVDRVDSYLLHRDEPSRPVDDIAETLTALVADGITARVGVSNWSAPRVAALVEALGRIDGPSITWVSNYFGLAAAAGEPEFSGVETTGPDLFALAHELDLTLLAWSPQSSGYFAGRDDAGAGSFHTAENRRRREVLDQVAREHSVSPVALLARWLVTTDSRLVPVLGSTRPAHLAELIAATSAVSLDPAVATLEAELGAATRDPGAWTEAGTAA